MSERHANYLARLVHARLVADLRNLYSKMLVVTLSAQVQPVFVDLRTRGGGRWELEVPKEQVEEEEEEEEDTEVHRKNT